MGLLTVLFYYSLETTLSVLYQRHSNLCVSTDLLSWNLLKSTTTTKSTSEVCVCSAFHSLCTRHNSCDLLNIQECSAYTETKVVLFIINYLYILGRLLLLNAFMFIYGKRAGRHPINVKNKIICKHIYTQVSL